MTTLASTTCDLHRDRPASARCPSCGRFFCSECITEHDGRLTCARCLQATWDEASGKDEARASSLRRGLTVVVQGLLGLALSWGIFYAVARLLMAIPADFHDGTLWQE